MKRDETVSTPPPCEAMARALLAEMDPALAELAAADLDRLLERIRNRSAGHEAAPEFRFRWQDSVIEREIDAGASVLDLGCGDGELLRRLMRGRGVRGQGIELDSEAVLRCVERGVPVIQADLDRGLSGYADRSFDYVVLEQTLQTLNRPTEVLEEMLRVGVRGIVSFPNFGHWRVRLELALLGRRPTAQLGGQGQPNWSDTAHIRPLTVQDFRDWAASAGATLEKGYALVDHQVRALDAKDNLYAEEALLVIGKK